MKEDYIMQIQEEQQKNQRILNERDQLESDFRFLKKQLEDSNSQQTFLTHHQL